LAAGLAAGLTADLTTLIHYFRYCEFRVYLSTLTAEKQIVYRTALGLFDKKTRRQKSRVVLPLSKTIMERREKNGYVFSRLFKKRKGGFLPRKVQIIQNTLRPFNVQDCFSLGDLLPVVFLNIRK
jgi:hypothetical protein